MYYVTMTDKFMSGWGRAEGKINKFIVKCNTLAQAREIEEFASRRSEMKYIKICGGKPYRYYSNPRYLVSERDYENIHWR